MTLKKSQKQAQSDLSRQAPEPLKPLTRHQAFLQGIVTVEELDDDELSKGKIKGYDGTFARGNPRIPPGLQNRIDRELRKRLLVSINKYGVDAIETIADVMYRGEGASAYQGQKDGVKRLEAAKYLLERIVGPIPSKSEISINATVWEGLVEEGGLFVDVDPADIEETIEEPEDVETPEPPARKRGPRTRPRRKVE